MSKGVKKSKHYKAGPYPQQASVKPKLEIASRRAFSILENAVAWRFVVVWLIEVSSFSVMEAAKMVNSRASEVIKWCNRFWKDGNVEDSERSGRPSKISEKDVTVVKEALAKAAPGTGLKVILQKLRQEKKIQTDFSEERMRGVLNNTGWSYQKVKVRLPLSVDHMDSRWAFGVKYRDVGLGNRAIFTDSKYFVGGTVDVATKNAGFHSWAPDGEPRSVIKTQGNTYSVHAYGGICKYGLTELLIVSGTKGIPSAYTVERKNPLYVKGDKNCKEKETISTEVNAVNHVEYRDIIMGGGPRNYKGLIKDAKRMFEANGVQQWYWQQDGAPSHSIKQTEIGKETMRLIHTVTKNIVDWPPCSPDLSPIETVWQHVERVMWRDYTWSDQQSFREALLKAWKAVGNDKKFIKNVMASVDRRAVGGDEGGRIAQVISRKGGQTDY